MAYPIVFMNRLFSTVPPASRPPSHHIAAVPVDASQSCDNTCGLPSRLPARHLAIGCMCWWVQEQGVDLIQKAPDTILVLIKTLLVACGSGRMAGIELV